MVAESDRLRLVFCGTPDFAVPTLEALLAAGHQVPLVLTQPDRPAGRGLALKPSAIKQLAQSRGLTLAQPERLRSNEEFRSTLERVAPDAIVVVAYGRLIPSWMLELPRLGNLNLHGSLLPKYRGAAPIQWAVANGESETGVSTMKLDIGMDTGDVLLERRVSIGPDTMATDLFPQLAAAGATLMVQTLQGLATGSLHSVPQDGSQATLAPLLTREDGRIDLPRQTATTIYNRWRGFSPWPGVHTRFRGKRLLLHRVRPATEPESDTDRVLGPGALRQEAQLTAGAAERTRLVLEEVQLEGKARMSGPEFFRDFQVRRGECLG